MGKAEAAMERSKRLLGRMERDLGELFELHNDHEAWTALRRVHRLAGIGAARGGGAGDFGGRLPLARGEAGHVTGT